MNPSHSSLFPQAARVLLAASLVACASLSAADWPQFRGPRSNGVSDESNPPPSLLDTNTSIAWKANLSGRGLSCPIVVGDRVFITSSGGQNQQRLSVVCLNASDGSTRWERQFWATGRTTCHRKTCVAAPTPASDGQSLFALFSSNDLLALDLDGNLRWFRGLGLDYPHAGNGLGMSSSLVIADGVVVAQVESDSDAFTVGCDARFGTNRWKLQRPRKANWSSPLILKNGSVQAVGLQGEKGFTVVEPATGKTIWEYADTLSTVPSCTLGEGTLFVPSHGLTAIQPSTNGESPRQLWRSAQLNLGTASPLVVGQKVFVLNDGGILTCAETGTGKRLWQLRLKGAFSATPIAAGQFLYCVSEQGLVQVVDADKPEGEVVSELDLGETILATPAISRGAIYFRSDTHLWKLAKPQPPQARGGIQQPSATAKS